MSNVAHSNKRKAYAYMSADNGIYVAEFKNGYRVIEASAIDNLYYHSKNSKENKEVWHEYWDKAKVFKTKEEALLYAHELAEECYILEYGVNYIGKGIEYE